MPQRRTGFSLVEVLVVIVIIGVLVALLLPAVQAARESSRRSACSSNLRQIGLATINYAAVRRRLPPGGGYTSHPGSTFDSNLGTPALLGSATMYLLPFIEQAALFARYNFGAATTTNGQSGVKLDEQRLDGSYAGSTTNLIRRTVLPVYICPSDSDRPVNTTTLTRDTSRGSLNYAASAGARKLSTTGNNSKDPCPCVNGYNTFYTLPLASGTQYVTSGPFHRLTPVHGTASGDALSKLTDLTTKPHEVTDGLSKTIFFGEVRPGCSSEVNGGWGVTNNGCGLISTQIPINYDSCRHVPANVSPRGSGDNCNLACNWVTSLGFKSRHPGGALFVFGDGKTAFLPESIDHWVYQALGGKADGGSIGPNNAAGRKGVQAVIP